MRRIALAVSLLVMISSVDRCAAAPAQSRHPRIHLEGGLGSAHDFNDGLKAGFGAGAGIEMGIRKRVSIGFDVDYNHHGLDEERLTSDIPKRLPANWEEPSVSGVIIHGGSLSVFTALATVKVDFPASASITPYLKLGAGYGQLSRSEQNVSFLAAYKVRGTARSAIRSYEVPFASIGRLAASIGAGVRQQSPGSRVGYAIEARMVTISAEPEAAQAVSGRAGFVFGF